MINRISFASMGYAQRYNGLNYNKQPKSESAKEVSFRGILDEPGTQRVTDANGNTYIIEPGGNIVVHNYSDKDNKKNSSVGDTVSNVAAGAGGGALLGNTSQKISKSKSEADNSDDIQNHEVKKNDDLNESDAINKDETEISQDEVGTDISETEFDDEDSDPDDMDDMDDDDF